MEIAPRVAPLRIEPKSAQRLEFAVASPRGPAPAYWAVVKVFYNGRVEYKPVPGLTIPDDA
jgi:hypothetical protein